MIWIHFIFSSLLVVSGGYFLARQGKELAERYGLTDLWVGFIFLSAVTSIPELATALGAVTVAASPSLALSDILGSNSFNLFALGVFGVVLSRSSLFAGLTIDAFRLLLGMIVLMTAVILGGTFLERWVILPTLGGISLTSWAVLVLYLFGSWQVFRDERQVPDPLALAEPARVRAESGRFFFLRLFISIFQVVAGGFWLAWAGSGISAQTGWGDGFVGALFLALITSLPEISVSLGAVKIRAPRLLLGNILGSSIFNLGIIFWTDLAYRQSSILVGMEAPVIVSGVLGLILVLLVALSLKLHRPGLGREAVMINLMVILVYLVGMRWIFLLSVRGAG